MSNDHFTSAGRRVALISVTDKTNLLPFARGLVDCGFFLLSTGGTAQLLREHDIPVEEVANYTGHPEMLGGRVKTLHPRIHGGILFDRDDAAHGRDVSRQDILPIDLVIVNLYRFESEAVAKGLELDQAIEHIDIGGPTMLRAAAKNHRHSLPVIDPSDYELVLSELKAGGLSLATRRSLAAKTFQKISEYDAAVASYMAHKLGEASPTPTHLPQRLNVTLVSEGPLRYGENPHQAAGFYHEPGSHSGFAGITVLQGKEVSYNNLLDLDAASALAMDLLPLKALVIVKHTNPSGVAAAPEASVASLFEKALACDRLSAFGGIIATNQPVDEEAATAMTGLFLECIIAPDFTREALAVFATKKNLRLVKASFVASNPRQAEPVLRSIRGGYLVQARDEVLENVHDWRCVTQAEVNGSQRADLHFAMVVAKHVKSNAIVFARNLSTLAIGAGQMSRIDAARFASEKALAMGHSLKGSALASDAFFPFRDTVDVAAACGVTSIAQPGGSQRDQESITACDEQGIAMVFTGVRHFRH